MNTYLSDYHHILNQMIHGMTTAHLTDSISYNFMVQMIPHHRAAIQMSRNILKYTMDARLRAIASHIITEQTKSIADMETILCSCGMLQNSRQDLCLFQCQMNHIMSAMFSQMAGAPSTGNVSVDFMLEMIPHHKGAIFMSETALQYPICPELKPILSAIISSQKEGVMQMEYLPQTMKNSASTC